jgi:hypothetical protein
MPDDQAIASTAHPTGSAQAEISRAYILQRMTALGLDPAVAPGDAVERLKWFRTPVVSGGHVNNLVGTLKGTDPSLGAVMMMAHSDSVPGSPGAADDAAGVVTLLETVRALEASGPHRRDVVVAITDGEEPGLLGARALFAPLSQGGDPRLTHVGVILNFEARGGGGRVSMFETGPSNEARIGLFSSAVHNTNANSLMSEVYKYMPNSTDFTVAEMAGFVGYNFAFIGKEFDYHSPSSTPAALDKGSLQHMGEQAVAIARTLADAPTLPARTGDAAYSDLLGGPVLAYPAGAGWAILGLAIALVVFAAWRARVRGERVRALAMLHGAGGALVITFVTGAVLWAAGMLTGAGSFPQGRRLLAQFPFVFGGMSLLAIGVALFSTGPLRRGRDWTVLMSRPEDRLSSWIGVFGVVALLTLLLQALAPPMAMLSAWPLLLGAASMALIGGLGRNGWDAPGVVAVAFVAAVLAQAHLGHLADQTFTAVGVAIPELLALFVLLVLVVIFPLVEGFASDAFGKRAALCVAGLGVVILAYAAVHDPASARTPSPTQAFYVQDAASGKSWRASTFDRLDPWSKAALNVGGVPTKGALPGLADAAWLTPAPAAALARPEIQTSVVQDRVTVHIQSRADGRELRLTLIPSASVRDVTLDGHPAPILAKAGEASGVRWCAPQGGLTLAFTAPSPASLDLRYAEIRDGWPAGMAPPPKPAAVMPWGLSDTSVLLDHYTLKW